MNETFILKIWPAIQETFTRNHHGHFTPALLDATRRTFDSFWRSSYFLLFHFLTAITNHPEFALVHERVQAVWRGHPAGVFRKQLHPGDFGPADYLTSFLCFLEQV
jgi:hypothetical protein